MILTSNNRLERQKLSNQLYDKQIKLENQMKPKLMRLFRDMGNDAANLYISTRAILPVNNYLPQMITILRDQYRLVIPQFGFLLRNQLKKRKSWRRIITKQIDDDFEIESTVYINNTSEEQADIIIENQQKQFTEITNKVLVGLLLIMGIQQNELDRLNRFTPQSRTAILQSLVDNNNTLTKEQKDKKFRRLMKREIKIRSKGRADSIAMTETNGAANWAIQTESTLAQKDDSLIEEAATVGIMLNALNKEWVAILDTKTRHTHAVADGQIVPLLEPFRVGDSLLNYPKDTSLGAPLSEIINCRCKSIPTTQPIDRRL